MLSGDTNRTLTRHYLNAKIITWRNEDIAKKRQKSTFVEIDYSTDTPPLPRAKTPDNIPVFCAHDNIILIILQHIDQMLRYYKIDCEQSGREEEMRRYRITMATYIDNEKKVSLKSVH